MSGKHKSVVSAVLGRAPGRDLRAEELERVAREREARGSSGCIQDEISDRMSRFLEIYEGNIQSGPFAD
jgi:hypothetical protein